MKLLFYFLILFLISNVSLIIAFFVGKNIFRKDDIHLSSNYAVFLSVLLIFYLVSTLALNLFSFNTKYFLLCLILLPFIFVPFVIGQISSYERINFYTNVQILTLCLSFLTGVFVFSRVCLEVFS